jgi:hypothetical protein
MLLLQSTSHNSQILFPSPRQNAVLRKFGAANVGVVAHVLATTITGYVVLDIGQHSVRAMLGNEGRDGDQAVAIARLANDLDLIGPDMG